MSFWSRLIFVEKRIKGHRARCSVSGNNVRRMVGTPLALESAAIAVKEEEPEGTTEPIRRPAFFTGDLPLNTIVDISAFNRPDQTAFTKAVNTPPSGYEEDPGAKRVMPQKAPYACEWPTNEGWNAQVRLDQRIRSRAK